MFWNTFLKLVYMLLPNSQKAFKIADVDSSPPPRQQQETRIKTTKLNNIQSSAK